MAVKTRVNLPCPKRLRGMVKGLVISLGYLEHWLEKGEHPLIQQAASGLDSAIDALNDYLDQA